MAAAAIKEICLLVNWNIYGFFLVKLSAYTCRPRDISSVGGDGPQQGELESPAVQLVLNSNCTC